MKGKCLCGAIEIDAADYHEVGICHCSMCRRWSGGPSFAVHADADVRFIGEPATYRSSDWAERGFCPKCGTHLFYRLLSSGEYALSAGLFQDEAFRLAEEIFVEEQPPFYRFGNDLPRLTGQEAFDRAAQK